MLPKWRRSLQYDNMMYKPEINITLLSSPLMYWIHRKVLFSPSSLSSGTKQSHGNVSRPFYSYRANVGLLTNLS